MSTSQRPAVILVRPQRQGNVGAVARAMANMGLERLLLVEPAVELGTEARAFAVKAGAILDGARRLPSLAAALAAFQRAVGTTSSRNRSLQAPLSTPRELAAELAAGPALDTALVFGPEASGLTVDELALCSHAVSIPAALRQPTLNLAQAVLVVAYELYLAGLPAVAQTALDEVATSGEVDGLFAQLEPLLSEVGFARDDTFQGVLRDLRQLAARAGLRHRELAILRGICRRTQGELDRRGNNRG